MITIEWLRQFKIEGYAIFDIVISFIGVFLLSPILSRIVSVVRLKVSRKSWLFLTLPLSILIHVIVGNFTLMTRNFLDLNNHYILKIFIILLVILGIKDIKIKGSIKKAK